MKREFSIGRESFEDDTWSHDTPAGTENPSIARYPSVIGFLEARNHC